MRTPAPLTCATAVVVAATGVLAAVMPAAHAGAPTKEVVTERSFELNAEVPFATCDGFTVANEFIVTTTDITFADRQIRHVSYTGRLYRVDRVGGDLVVGDSVQYEGRFTRTAEFSAGGGPDDFTTLRLSGRRATLVTDDGRRQQLATGLVEIDVSADPPVRVKGIDDSELVCEALA